MLQSRRPANVPQFPTRKGGQPHKVRLNESLVTIANELSVRWHAPFTWQQLADFNFGTSDPAEVNWCLHRFVGARKIVGSNYIFTDRDRPGIIWLPPKPTPVPDPPKWKPQPRRHPTFAAPRSHTPGQDRSALKKGCTTIWDYIAVVEKIERRNPALARNPVLLVTQLRKVWAGGAYSGFKWNRMLPATKRVKPLPLGGFTQDERKLLSKLTCLRTPQHDCIDFGHTLTGIDASNHPSNALPALWRGRKVVAGCTWSGDLGSAYRNALMWTHHRPQDAKNRLLLNKRIQTAWENYCSQSDLLGDVDGVVLGSRFSKTTPLSRQLRTYYNTGRTQGRIFNEFVKVDPSTASHIRKMTWAWIQARALTPSMSAMHKTILNELVRKFMEFVSKGRKGALNNCCKIARARWLKQSVPKPPSSKQSA